MQRKTHRWSRTAADRSCGALRNAQQFCWASSWASRLATSQGETITAASISGRQLLSNRGRGGHFGARQSITRARRRVSNPVMRCRIRIFLAPRIAGSTTPAGAVSNGEYFQFAVAPDVGLRIDCASLTFDVGRGSSSTPRGWVVRSSVDAFQSNVAANTIPTVIPTLTNVQIDLHAPQYQGSRRQHHLPHLWLRDQYRRRRKGCSSTTSRSLGNCRASPNRRPSSCWASAAFAWSAAFAREGSWRSCPLWPRSLPRSWPPASRPAARKPLSSTAWKRSTVRRSIRPRGNRVQFPPTQERSVRTAHADDLAGRLHHAVAKGRRRRQGQRRHYRRTSGGGGAVSDDQLRRQFRHHLLRLRLRVSRIQSLQSILHGAKEARAAPAATRAWRPSRPPTNPRLSVYRWRCLDRRASTARSTRGPRCAFRVLSVRGSSRFPNGFSDGLAVSLVNMLDVPQHAAPARFDNVTFTSGAWRGAVDQR